jgi:hypothetical protein
MSTAAGGIVRKPYIKHLQRLMISKHQMKNILSFQSTIIHRSITLMNSKKHNMYIKQRWNMGETLSKPSLLQEHTI